MSTRSPNLHDSTPALSRLRLFASQLCLRLPKNSLHPLKLMIVLPLRAIDELARMARRARPDADIRRDARCALRVHGGVAGADGVGDCTPWSF